MRTNTLESSSFSKQLIVLRDITQRTGVIHPAQAFQLKMWAALMSPKKDSFEIQVDPDLACVEFIFKTLSQKGVKETTKLDVSVKFLLGDNWLVRCKSAGKVIFVGKRKQAHTPIEPEKKEVPWRDRLVLPQKSPKV